MFYKCCYNREKLYKQLVAELTDVIYLFSECVKTFDELVNEQKDICPGCRLWLKGHHVWYGGKNEKKKTEKK